MKFISNLLIINSFLITAMASEFYPSNLIQLDDKFAHHVLVVEKSSHKLYLYQNKNGMPELKKTYDIATGKIKGNKFQQGDHKTPEGIYVFQRFHSDKDLLEKYGKYAQIYGAGAFTTNYPNIFDKKAGKSGGGIWLHSTDDDNRVSKGLDSRGCVVASDADLKEISQFIDLANTPIVIVENHNFHLKETWMDNKQSLKNFVENWTNAWKNKDFEAYIGSYSKEFKDPSKGAYSQYKQYKRAVFARNDKPEINFSHISILKFDNYALVTMEQDYKSDIIQDIGKKTLFLELSADYDWKIIAERWHKIGEESRNLAFTPTNRFFTNIVEKSDSTNEKVQ